MITRKNLQCVFTVLVFAALICLTGCSGGAYKASGQYKRDILVERIEKTRQCHERAKRQFEVLLANYSNVVDASASDSDLRGEYNKLDKEYKKTRAVTKELSRRIKAIESIGKPLFRRWEDELGEYENETIRRSSEEHLDLTRSNYLKVVHAIKNTEDKTQNILKSLNDQILFLSQNLNARAQTSFKKEVKSLKKDVADLVKQIEIAIKESDKFSDVRSVVAAKVEE